MGMSIGRLGRFTSRNREYVARLVEGLLDDTPKLPDLTTLPPEAYNASSKFKYPNRVFDGDEGNYGFTRTIPGWVSVDLGDRYTLNGYRITRDYRYIRTTRNAPTAWELHGSVDGNNWFLMSTVQDTPVGRDAPYEETFTVPFECKYVRLTITGRTDTRLTSVGEVSFF